MGASGANLIFHLASWFLGADTARNNMPAAQTRWASTPAAIILCLWLTLALPFPSAPSPLKAALPLTLPWPLPLPFQGVDFDEDGACWAPTPTGRLRVVCSMPAAARRKSVRTIHNTLCLSVSHCVSAAVPGCSPADAWPATLNVPRPSMSMTPRRMEASSTGCVLHMLNT